MTVKFFATYRDITKCKELTVPAPRDVWALLAYLGERYGPAMQKKLYTPDGGDIGQDAIVLVNGRNAAHIGGKEAALADADVVSIFPMVAGG